MHSDAFPFDVIIADDRLCALASEYVQTLEEERLLGIANDYEEAKWRTKHFCKKIMDYLPLCALSQEEREKSLNASYSVTEQSVSRLRSYVGSNTKKNSGEIGEILLYGIMQHYYNAAESVPKIFHKQNTNDLVTGADSVHIVADNDDFSFWLGEAKIYKNLNQAMTSAAQSVRDMLERTKLNKEKSLILGLKELRQNIQLAPHIDSIVKILSENASIDDFRKKLHVPILLVGEDDKVAQSVELDTDLRTHLRDKCIEEAQRFYEKLKDQLKSVMQQCRNVRFHLIIFPIPSVEEVNNQFAKLKLKFTDD